MRLVKEQMAIPNVKSPNPTPRGIGKEEVNKAVQEALAATQEENVERNAQVTATTYDMWHWRGTPFITTFYPNQVQSLITEVQNIIGQTREVGTQCRELTDKVSSKTQLM